MKKFLLLLSLTVLLSGQTDERQPYFSLTSAKTYSTSEKAFIQLAATDVADLDFRVYKINDPVKFFRQMPDPHQFGGEAPRPARKQTLIEQFHHLKASWHSEMRYTVRGQFTDDAWQQVRTWRVRGNTNDRESNVTQYANAPVLNQQQMVATWRQHVKSLGRWRQQSIPVEVTGKGVYLVEAVHEQQRAYTVLMISDMALITKTGRGRMVAYTADRISGKPIAGANILLASTTTKTDAQGLADVPVPPDPDPRSAEQLQIFARNGDDFAVDSLYGYVLRGVAGRDYVGYAYTDRPVYRPGHTVHFRYILRSRSGNAYEIPKISTVNVEVQGSDDKPIFRKTFPVSAMGTASGDFTLPKDAALGFFSIQIKTGDFETHAQFEVQEYKKPEYDVRVTVSKARILQGDDMRATIDARYFFGEPVAHAKVQYSVHRSQYWFPLFDAGEGGDDSGDGNPDADMGGGGNIDDSGGDELSDQEGALDANGQLVITLPTKFQPDAHGDVRYRIEAKVTDAGNREVSGHGNVIATYGSFAVNIQPNEYVVNAGSSSSFKLSSFDYDGKPVQAKFDVQLYSGYDTKTGTFISQASAQTGEDGHAAVSFTLPKAGTYYVRAVAVTPGNRKVESYGYVWVSGSGPSIYGAREGSIQIVADKKSYRPGDVAKILIITGVPNASVLFSREGSTLGEVKLIPSTGTSITVEVPIGEADEPDIFVSALFLKDNKFYQGSKRLSVPPTEKKLSVVLTSSKVQYRPGETGQFTVEARDSNGKPVAGEFSVGIVDEALYGVRQDTTQDITQLFYGAGYNAVGTANSMVYFFHGEAGKRRMMLAELSKTRHTLAQLKPDRLVQPKVRKEFPDTALWLPAVTTGADGKGIANVAFPDSVTTWRTTTRGITADSKVGGSTLKTVVRKNIILRMVTPRFFTQNDEVVISAVIHNYLINDKQARVSLDVKGLDIIDGGTRDIAIPTRGEVKVDWRVRASSLGDSVLTGKVLTDEESDAVEVTLPVEPQGVKITKSRSGSRSGSQSGALNIAFPKAVVPLSRQLEISVSPSIAGALFGAIEYLTDFPYGCTEQTLSSFVPNVIVSKALSDLNIRSDVNQQVLSQKIRAGLDRLYDFQHEDGGWGWWKTDESGIFMTTAVVAGFAQAKAAGVELKPEALENGVKWLKAAYAKEPRMLPDLKAYSIYSLALAGDNSLIEDGWNQRSRMTTYGRALLGLAMESAKDARSAQIAATVEADVKTNESEAWWPNDRDTLMDFYADTSSETTAFALKLLVHEKPQSPLLAKAAVYLMNHRSEGFYWYSTKQTAMVVYGLTDYLKATGELKPNLKATITVNGKQVLTKAFQPADAMALADTRIEVPGVDSNDIKIESSGEGRLYWSVKQTYYSTDQKSLKQGGANLNILRDYFKLTPGKDGEKIVYGLDPLQGPLAVGDILAVRITVTGTEWKYLLMEDPIPAGAEFIERDDLYELKQRPDWWTTYFSRREFHDDRAAIFQTYFNAGQKQYFYLLKVVNPGAFKVSPARVQPMYQPDLLSTTENKEVVIK